MTFTPEQDRALMEVALAEARRCKPEDERQHPLVGAVAAREGIAVATAFRGEIEPGEHAEYTLLERKLKDQPLAGATIFTTLEPCTTRTHPKVPCAERLVERGVTRVLIGMLDPNPNIRGTGVLKLREARIAVDFFASDVMLQLEDLNRDFTRAQRQPPLVTKPTASAAAKLQQRTLKDWYTAINKIYWNRNFHLHPADIFTHLVEVVGGLSGVASKKEKAGVDAGAYMAKSIAWWLALCGKVGIRSIEDILWDKFPGACPYCRKDKCLGEECGEQKAAEGGLLWDELALIAESRVPPKRLRDWQQMFGTIYPVPPGEDVGAVFGRLTEELGELAEALRVFPAEPGYFLSEAADVFAWLMHVQNRREADFHVPRPERGLALETELTNAYPDGCGDCGQRVCSCPPILASTIGRIAHEVPTGRAGFDKNGRFDSPDRLRAKFQDLGGGNGVA